MAGGVSPKDIYDELIAQGASTIQAVGIMANMINESSLDVETGAGGTAIDSNGYPVYGLVSWNTASYPNAGTLVTGNPKRDLKAQVTYLAQTGGFRAAQGNTPQQAAGNFAQNYERCASCQPGGQQFQAREANAGQVSGWVTSGNWPTSSGSASQTAVLTSAQATAQQQSCAWGISLPGAGPVGSGIIGGALQGLGLGGVGAAVGLAGGPQICVLSKSQARALIGTGLLISSGIIALSGVAFLLVAAFGRSDLARLAEKVPGVGAFATVAETASSTRLYQRGGAGVVSPPPQSRPAAQTGTRADSRGTSPEFRRQFLGES